MVVEYNQIELDYCTHCKGVWFDRGEVDLLLESVKVKCPELDINALSNLPENGSGEKPLKCPVCGQSMKEVAVGHPTVSIDICRQTDGLWFDGGELKELLKQTVENTAAQACSEQMVFGFLGEVFQSS